MVSTIAACIQLAVCMLVRYGPVEVPVHGEGEGEGEGGAKGPGATKGGAEGGKRSAGSKGAHGPGRGRADDTDIVDDIHAIDFRACNEALGEGLGHNDDAVAVHGKGSTLWHPCQVSCCAVLWVCVLWVVCIGRQCSLRTRTSRLLHDHEI